MVAWHCIDGNLDDHLNGGCFARKHRDVFLIEGDPRAYIDWGLGAFERCELTLLIVVSVGGIHLKGFGDVAIVEHRD